MVYTVELYRGPVINTHAQKPMPNGLVRQDANGDCFLDYLQGAYATSPSDVAGWPAAPSIAAIPDQGDDGGWPGGELWHFAGWAHRRRVGVYHRDNGDGTFSAVMVVGAAVSPDWFAAAPGPQPIPSPGPAPAPAPSPAPVDLSPVLTALADIKAAVVKADNDVNGVWTDANRAMKASEANAGVLAALAARPHFDPTDAAQTRALALALLMTPPGDWATSIPAGSRSGTLLQDMVTILFLNPTVWQAIIPAIDQAIAAEAPPAVTAGQPS